MRTKRLVLMLAALVLVVVLAACGGSSGGGGGNEDQGSGGGNGPEETAPANGQGGEETAGGQEEQGPLAEVPEDTTLALSIPKLDKEIENIPTGRGDDEQLLTDNAAVHIEYPTVNGDFVSWYPWERGANVYLAGHVEGYEGTPSYKAFDGVKALENGDEIIVTDANGTRYTYAVYEKKVVEPTAVETLNPVPGKNVVTLQTCELVNFDENGNPDYSNTERLIVRGELQDVQA
jgi:sortase A